jgi:hypothetical protein
VDDYRRQFEEYMYHLLSLDPTLSAKFFVTQFVIGLKDELRTAVKIQAQTSITKALVFAKILEEEVDANRPHFWPPPAGRPPPAAAPVYPRPAGAPGVRRAAGDDFAREWQL